MRQYPPASRKNIRRRPIARLGSVAVATILLSLWACQPALAGTLIWNVTSGLSQGPAFPASDTISIDVGPAPPPGSIPDGGTQVVTRTHAVEMTLLDLTTPSPLAAARLVATDPNEFGYGARADVDLIAGYTNPEFLPGPITLRVRFDYRPDLDGGLAGYTNPTFAPAVAFDDDSFRVDYELDLAGYTTPIFEPIQRHSLQGEIAEAMRPIYRITSVDAVLGSLDLSVVLSPWGTDPVSGSEQALLRLSLTGETAQTSALVVPEPSTGVLLALGLSLVALARCRSRRAA